MVSWRAHPPQSVTAGPPGETPAARMGHAARPVAGDDVLTARDGQLMVEDVLLSELATEFETPLHVISETQLRLNARRWRRAAEERWSHGPTMVMPSLKANPATALRRILNDEGLGCDVFGANELEIALRAGVPAEWISLGGVTKPVDALARAVEAGVRVTVDSLDEMRRLAAVAGSAGRVATVRFRVRPALPSYMGPSDFDPLIAASELIQEYRAGIPRGELRECVALALRAPGIDPAGFAAHATRQTTELSYWFSYAEEVGRVAATIAAEHPGWEPRELDLGGGFAVPRDPTGRKAEDPPGEPLAPEPEDYLDVLVDGLANGLIGGRLDPSGIRLELEPGRAMYANAGLHLTRVLHVKRELTPRPRTWVETDTSEAFLPDTLIERNRWTVLPVAEPEREGRMEAAVTGCSCGFDQLVPRAAMPAVAAGELLAFLDTGAYQEAASSNFNAMGRPATVLVSGSERALIRRRETVDDVLACDLSDSADAASGGPGPGGDR